MSKRRLVVLLLVLGIVGLFGVEPAWAIGEKIESSLWKIIDWITLGLGVPALVFGFAWMGIKVAMGSEDAFRSGGRIVLGGLVVFGARALAELIKAVF